MTKAELDAQIAALQAEKERLEAMTPEERAEAQRAAVERKQREADRKGREQRRLMFLAVYAPISMLLVWASNQDGLPLAAWSWAAYANGGLALTCLLWYLVDRFQFLEFDIYEICREKWQAAVAVACTYILAASIGMLAGSGNVVIGAGSAAGHGAGGSSGAGAGHTFVFQFGDRSDTVRTSGGADRQRTNGTRGQTNGRPGGSGRESER